VTSSFGAALFLALARCPRAGKRMIAQGTDGLSRGDLDSGVMRSADMLSFVPLHLSALERAPGLMPWLHTWTPGLLLRSISPLEWYTVGHGITGFHVNADGIHLPECTLSSHVVLVWAPAPTAAEAALEELSTSRHKLPHLSHIVLCPRLFTHAWRKRLYKLADYVFFLPAGRREDVWPSHAFEPLIVGVILPFLPSAPWCLRQSTAILQLDASLRACWSSAGSDDTSLLSSFSRTHIIPVAAFLFTLLSFLGLGSTLRHLRYETTGGSWPFLQQLRS
jgi:hypothetical protein